MRNLLTGNQIIIQAVLDAGADAFFGYPITPATGILEGWVAAKIKNPDKNLISLQAEDEMAAGFAMIGSILAGKKAFTATSGPGNVLMQDAFSMAEAMRIPTVAFIMQRGGPSTGTVIYSQSETTLTCFGGNGEGMRIVYSSSSLEELYQLGRKAFNAAWKYRFPTFVLSDGYQAKMQGNIDIENSIYDKNIPAEPFLLNPKKDNFISLRNCYNTEEELAKINRSSKKEFEKISSEIAEYEEFGADKAKILLIAHGIVTASIKQAIINFGLEKKARLFRPITLRPFPAEALKKAAKNKKKIIILESSDGQMGRIAKEFLLNIKVEIEEKYKSGEGFYPEEIAEIIKYA